MRISATGAFAATGTVDIDERLVSYVQLRFPGYIRQVFTNATYLLVHKGATAFYGLQPRNLVQTQKRVSAGAAEQQTRCAARQSRWREIGRRLVEFRGRRAPAAVEIFLRARLQNWRRQARRPQT